jgi:hydrogenase-4 component B
VTAILSAWVVLLGGAVSSVALSRRPRTGLMIALLSIVCASTLGIAAALPHLTRSIAAPPVMCAWALPLGEAQLAIDGPSAWFLLTIGIISMAVSIYTWSYFQAEMGQGSVPAFGAFLCLLVASLMLVVTAADAVMFLIGWELLMLAAFFLVSYHHRQAEVRRAAWIYLIVNHVATALFVVPLFGILAAVAGTTGFSEFRAALQDSGPRMASALFLLGLFGFGTKAGFMPLHIWLPVAHPAAPTPASALLSGIVIKAGIYGLLRLLGWLPNLPTSCAVVMLAFGMTSGVIGVLYALAQHDIKRLLAYHSVENIGIIGLGIGIAMLGETLGRPGLVALGYAGALLHVLNHALFKGLLFLSAGAVIHATGTGVLERLGGLARRTPINAAVFLIAAISICGLPPFNGFVSEWLIYGSLFGGAMGTSRASAGVAALGALSLALMGGLALACFAKVFGVVFLGETRDSAIRAHPTPLAMKAGMVVPAVLCIAIGLLPSVFVRLTVGGVSAVSGMTAADATGSIKSALAPAWQLSVLALVLLAALLGLSRLRTAMLSRNLAHPAPTTPTWGCGYTRPSPRMQYTASSFAWSLIQSFRQVLWPHRDVVAPTGPFAGRASLELHTPDMAEHDLFAPMVKGVNRFFQMIRTVSWTGQPTSATPPPRAGDRISPLRVLANGVVAALRRRRIHVCMASLVLTLIVVFLIEALTTRAAATHSVAPAVRVIEGDSE